MFIKIIAANTIDKKVQLYSPLMNFVFLSAMAIFLVI